MASLYKRERSPYWWIENIDTSGKRRQRSTKLRYAITAESRRARALRDELTRREQSEESRSDGTETWQTWVPRLIEQRYSGSRLTLIRARAAWSNISAFLHEREIFVPRQLTRQQVRDFVDWRQTKRVELGVRAGKKNTAILEMKFLGIIMQEAIESGFCTLNPCLKLGLKRDKPRKKPPITIDEHRLITREVKKQPKWMRIAYKIGYWQGCRLSETCLPLADVDLNRNTFGTRTKGKKDEIAEFPLSPKLRPLFRRLKREGRAMTYDPPKSSGKEFWKFFHRIGLPHLSTHCWRVTFITRCYERGIHREDVMRLAGHTTYAAHEIYPRLSASGHHLQELMRQSAA